MNPERLWAERKADYLREVMPYWKYVIGSGFGLALGAVLILSAHGYITLLLQLREGTREPSLSFVAAIPVTICLLWNPVRTYMKEADLIFLSPAESRMGAYFRGALTTGLRLSAAAEIAVLIAFWPLYEANAMGGALKYASVCVLLLALKALLFYGAWKERQFRERSVRRWFLAAKAIAAFASAVLLFQPQLPAYAFTLLAVWGAYALALRLPAAHRIHWEHLLHLEKQTSAAHERWFSLFVDLPKREETFRARAYLNGVLRLIRYRREHAFHYLYWRTFLRSSFAAMAFRLVVLVCALLWLFPHPWIASAIYVAGCLLLGIQLKGIQSVRVEPLFVATSPLPAGMRERALRSVQRTAHVCGIAIVAVLLSLAVPPSLTLGLLSFGAASAYLFAAPRRKKT